jgi:hypothetical protein
VDISATAIRAAVREFERDRWMMLSGEHLPCKGPGALMLERTPAGLRAVKNKYLLASIARAQLLWLPAPGIVQQEETSSYLK